MKTRTLLPALVALMAALALPAAAEELSITGMLTTAESANPALQSAALTLENARVAYDRSIASSDARLDQIKAELQWERAHSPSGRQPCASCCRWRRRTCACSKPMRT